MSLRHGVRLVAAALAVAAAGVVVPSPAQAATCGTATGVSVVVDFHQLGGGAQSFCDAGGATENAAHQFADAGYTLTFVDGEPFVCQVDGKPATQCQQTPPGNAYWSLWWSDGKSGQWKYSSVGVAQLKVPDGGYVALSWQGQTSQAKPRVPATAHASPSPSSAPTHPPTSHPTSSPAPSASSGASSSPSALATPPSSSAASPSGAGHRRPVRRHHPKPSGGASSAHAPTQAAAASGQVAHPQAPATSSGSGLPTWVAPIAIAVLFVGAGAIVLARRGSGGA